MCAAKLGGGVDPGRRRRRWGLAALLATTALALPAPAAMAAGNTLHVATGGSDTANDCLSAASPCATIQHAEQVAAPTDTISIGAGSWAESIDVDTAELAFVGAGQGQTILHAPPGQPGFLLAAAADGTRIEALAVDASDAAGIATEAGVAVNAVRLAHLTVSRVESDPPVGRGIDVSADAAGWTLDGVVVEHSEFGLLVAGAVSNLTIENGSFAFNAYGIYVDKGSSSSPGELDGFSLTDSAFLRGPGTVKQIYAEAMDDALLEDLTVEGGIQPQSKSPAGIDLNLKWDDYSDIVLRRIVSTGAKRTEGTRLDAPGIAVKARDDGVYEADPASLTGLDVESVSLTGNQIGLQLGDNVHAATVVDSRLAGNVNGGLYDYRTTGAGDLEASGNWWGCNAGPEVKAGTNQLPGQTGGCDDVNVETPGTTATVSPRLTLGVTVTPPVLQTGGSSAGVTAKLKPSSGGGPAAGFPGSVGFATDLGSLTSPVALLSDDTAETTLVSGATPGTATVSASLDGQTVSAAAEFKAPPVVPPAPAPPAPAQPAPGPPVVDTPGKPVTVEGPTPVVAEVSCGDSACDVGKSAGTVTIGGKKVKVKVKLPGKIPANGKVPVKIVLPKAVREALADGKVGKVRVTVTLTDASGQTYTKTITVKIKPKR